MSHVWPPNFVTESPINLVVPPSGGAEEETGDSVAPTGEPSAVVPARIALWQGARERGETGVEAADGWAAFAVFEIPSVPDFSSARFPDLSQLDEAQRVQRVGQLQSQFLTSLHPLGDRFGFSLRYCCSRVPGQEGRIRPFLIGRCFGASRSDAEGGLTLFRDAVRRGFPPEYRLIDWQRQDPDLVNDVLFPSGISAVAELAKPEHVAPAWHAADLCGFSFWYWPLPFQAAENDMTEFCRILTGGAGGSRVIVDVTLVPALPLTAVERAETASWGVLAEKWGRDQRVQRPGGLYSKPSAVEVAADPQAQEARKAYGDLLTRYGSPGSRLFLYAVRVLWLDGTGHPGTLANALAARSLSPGSAHQLFPLDTRHPAFERVVRSVHYSYITPAACNEPLWQRADAPETLRRLHRMVDLKEAAAFFRLPVPGRDGCPGIPLDAGLPERATGTAIVPHGLSLGRFVDGVRVTEDEAAFALNDLAKHGLIVGTPGSGKTTLCFSLLTQLWTEHRIPFLVLEPAKTEYRALLEVPGLREDLLVFTPGSERIAPFRFNPFEILPGVGVSEHLSTLNTCFSGAFSLADPLPMILDEAIHEVYADRGWSEYGVGGEDRGLTCPTLGDLLVKARSVAERSSYKGELAANIKGALETRLGSLMRGPKGRCFNTRKSLPVDLLLTRPVVLELDALGDDEKALLMMFLLTTVRAHARTTRRSGAPLSHVVLLEEAHTVIGRGDGAATEHRANPKEVSIRLFVRMLAEMRALGEGILIADQLPTAIAPEAVKNTNLKVMHRVVSLEDRQELGGSMVLDGGQLEQAAILPTGSSLVFMEGWSRSRHIVEPNFKAQHGVDVPPDDVSVRDRMAPRLAGEALRASYLPYEPCGAVCTRCDPLVREQSERWAEQKLPLISEALRLRPKDSPEMVAFEEYVHGFEAAPEESVRWHCVHVHLHERVLPAVREMGGHNA